MRVDYDKDLLAGLIRSAGGDLRLVERALAAASRAKDSPYVTGDEVREAMRRLRGDRRASPPPGDRSAVEP